MSVRSLARLGCILDQRSTCPFCTGLLLSPHTSSLRLTLARSTFAPALLAPPWPQAARTVGTASAALPPNTRRRLIPTIVHSLMVSSRTFVCRGAHAPTRPRVVFSLRAIIAQPGPPFLVLPLLEVQP